SISSGSGRIRNFAIYKCSLLLYIDI
ncbi:MAG: hypothetical protein K0Q59_4408, partial [Paenibacillus sp.]|nr:hypothetical protein [Paenibacillus sp.]